MTKIQLIIDIDENDWEWLKKKVKKTKKWVDDKDKLAGTGFCLSNDPEYAEDTYSVDVDIVMEYRHLTQIE